MGILDKFKGKKEAAEESEIRELERLQEATVGVAEELSIANRNIELAKAKDEVIFKSIGEGIIATDETGVIIKVSNSTPKLLGFDEGELLGQPYAEAIRLEDEKEQAIDPSESPISRALNIGELSSQYAYYVRKDGTKFVAHINASPIIMDGRPIGAIEVFRDETREREIDRMKTEFVSLASHQLKAPLTAIRGYTDMLREQTVGQVNEKQHDFLDQIFRSADSMGNLISDFLNVTKLEVGHLVVEPVPTDMGALVAELIEEVRPLAEARKCKVVLEKPSQALPEIPLDKRLFSQVIHNLLTNAIKYSAQDKEPKVTVTLKPSPDGQSVIISVADNGIGIPKAEQEKIFGRLYRASTAVKIAAEGTGLGLYLAKQIIEAAGGKIWFESEEGAGTTFFVSLPLSGMKSSE